MASPELPGEACRGPGLARESGFPEEVPGSQLWAPTPPICLTWEVTQGPEQVGDARLGLGFKVAAELSGMGMEDGREAVVFPGHPGRKGGTFIGAATQPVPPASVLGGSLPLPQLEPSRNRWGIMFAPDT